jgi:hypothetical protein
MNEGLFPLYDNAMVKISNVLQLLEGQLNDAVLFLYRRKQREPVTYPFKRNSRDLLANFL